MASIDQYKHRLLGFINCPSDYEIAYKSATRDIAVYELMQNIPDSEKDFDGKSGDILVGGGSGEAPAFRITIPHAMDHLILGKKVDFHEYDQLFKAFWTPTESYKLCHGFRMSGWNAEQPIELWLTENVCMTLINEVDKFKPLAGKRNLVSKLTWRV